MTTQSPTEAQAIATTILQQLGGNKFKVMTGSKNFIYAEITETNPAPWLRMDLSRNNAGVNRLKITLNSMDTYTMKFYRQTIKNYTEVVITKEQTFENVYADMMQSIFTKVTGLNTHL